MEKYLFLPLILFEKIKVILFASSLRRDALRMKLTTIVLTVGIDEKP